MVVTRGWTGGMMWMEGGGKLFYGFEVMDKGDSSPPGYSQAARMPE